MFLLLIPAVLLSGFTLLFVLAKLEPGEAAPAHRGTSRRGAARLGRD